MTTKQYLGQLHNIDRRIKDKIKESEKWRDIALSRSIGSSKSNDSDSVQSSHNHDKIADAVVKSVDYMNEAKNISVALVDKKHTIEAQIDSVIDDNNYNILHSYYVDEKPFSIIAEEEHISYKSVKRRYETAIIEFERVFGIDYL